MNNNSSDTDIINWYEVDDMKPFLTKTLNPNYDYHHLSIPHHAVIVGSTGTGKTNLVLSLIKVFSDKKLNKKKLGTFAHIEYYVPSCGEPLLQYLASKSNQIQIHENLDKLDIESKDPETNTLIIFDDQVCNKDQSKMLKAFMAGRKYGCSCIYLSQSMFATPIFLRKNAHYFWILRLCGKREIDLVMREFSLNMSKEQLRKIYEHATSNKFTPLMIDCTTVDPYKKFRKGIIEYINPDHFI